MDRVVGFDDSQIGMASIAWKRRLKTKCFASLRWSVGWRLEEKERHS